MIIGVTGKANSGKDTIADYLVNKYNFKKIALADPIKRMVKDVFVLDDNIVYDRGKREQPLPQWNNWSVRKLLQTIGTELFRKNIDDAIWVKSLWHKVKADSFCNYVVPDIRFPNELDFFLKNCPSFFSIKIKRNGCDGNVGLKEHESEAYDLNTDYAIENNGTFENLYEEIDCILKRDSVLKKYNL